MGASDDEDLMVEWRGRRADMTGLMVAVSLKDRATVRVLSLNVIGSR